MEFYVRYLALFLLFSVIFGFGWFWMGSLHKNIQFMLQFLKGPFLVLHLSCYTLITFLLMSSVILLSMLMILLTILGVIRHLICGSNQNWLVNWLLAGKSYLKMLGLTFSSKPDWGSYIISIAKTASKKIGALIRSMKFLSPEAALYLNKSTIGPCMEYCCHVWGGAHSCYMELLEKLQNWICSLFVLHLLPLVTTWPNAEMQLALVFSTGITLVDVFLMINFSAVFC